MAGAVRPHTPAWPTPREVPTWRRLDTRSPHEPLPNRRRADVNLSVGAVVTIVGGLLRNGTKGSTYRQTVRTWVYLT